MSHKPPAPGHPMVPLIALGAYTGLSVLVWAAAGIGGLINGTGWHAGNPLSSLITLALDPASWPGVAGWLVLVALVVILAGPAVLAWRVIAKRRRGRSRVDPAARSLAKPDDFGAYGPDGVAASAVRLRPAGVDPDNPDDHGVLLGDSIPAQVPFRSSWEDVFVAIAGPRTGKSTSWVVPSIVAAPGAVVATSNKRDIHDATRGVREQVGQCWVFDPQAIAGAEPQFWHNLLRRVTGPRRAAELTSHFVAGTRDADTKTDAYFDGEGENLCSYFLLAAARGDRPITQAYQWCANARAARDAPMILREAGDTLIANKLESLLDAPDKQRSGVFSSALKLLKCLEEPSVLRWVTPPADGEDRPEFDPSAFLKSRDTLYLLSREGLGSAGPLTAALTFDVLETGIEIAAQMPGARLDPPALSVLDEAANVVKIRELPNLYSHFGSRGLPVMTILQSWEQGCEAWGKSGMQKLWDASNVRLYGGGSADADFLGKLVQLVGPHDELTWSTTHDRTGGGSRSASYRNKNILEISHLQALPRGRALVFPSGSPAVLLQPRPWMTGPHADSIRYSLALYEPGNGSEGTAA